MARAVHRGDDRQGTIHDGFEAVARREAGIEHVGDSLVVVQFAGVAAGGILQIDDGAKNAFAFGSEDDNTGFARLCERTECVGQLAKHLPAERIDRRAAQGDGGDSIRNVQSQAFDGAAPGAGWKLKMIIYQLFEFRAWEQRRAACAFSLTAAPAPRKMTTCSRDLWRRFRGIDPVSDRGDVCLWSARLRACARPWRLP